MGRSGAAGVSQPKGGSEAAGSGQGADLATMDSLYPVAKPTQASPLQCMTPLQLAEVAGSEASQARSRQRCSVPTARGWELLNQLAEGKNFWFALRKHAPHQVCMEILEELARHSRWQERRNAEDEELRAMYHQYCRNVRHFQPDWKDDIMAKRCAEVDAAADADQNNP